MTNSEFSNAFSTLLNSYGTQANFGDQASRAEIVLDEYEKSVFLTQAQDIIVKSYYDRTLNQQGQGIDDSARRQVDFSSLIKVVELSPLTEAAGAGNFTGTKFDERAMVFQLPRRAASTVTTTSSGTSTITTTTTYVSTVTNSPADDNTDVLIILNEKLRKLSAATSGTTLAEYVVKPISYSEYDRQMSKAYTKPLKKQAWRLFQNQAAGFDVQSEIIPRDGLTGSQVWRYKLRYVKRPRPIVLEDLNGTGLTIDGVTSETSCELNPIIHMDILLKAVELAQASRGVLRQPEQSSR